jgi:2-polyprenyl-3-methyl-5-hydroxy-6-metoxy-1,4-benzoquinol methylase
VRDQLKQFFSRAARKKKMLRGTGLVASVPDRNPVGLTRTQELFLQWNAERLGISIEESKRRYTASWATVSGGHSGSAFGDFNGIAHETFRVFFEDNAKEVFDMYRYHGPMHFLVMLTYPEPAWAASDLIVRELSERSEISILDFGCGLAQQSRTLAEYLRDHGKRVRLTLADIPTLRQEFLIWWGKHTGIATTFLPCTAATPIPELPEYDICQTTEFFEHVHNPLAYFERIDAKLASGGLLVTGIMDHHADFMHVSPNLGDLRSRIAERGYEVLVADRILRKP